MNENLNKLQEYVLYQEQWNRATLSSFSTQGFDEINTILENLSSEDCEKAQEICEQQIQKNKNSIYALYISGILTIRENSLNDDLLIKLLEIFTDHHKVNVIEYIAKIVLKYRNNLYALKKLAEVYETANNYEELLPIWEQIVRIDFEEADILLKLAEYKDSHGEEQQAIKDYKKAIQRYLHQKNFTLIRNIWGNLVEKNPSDMDFYFQYINKMEKILSASRSETLLQILYEKQKDSEDYDSNISILKFLLHFNSEEEIYRENLVETYRNKHKDNPKLEDFIRMSNLTQSWRNIHEAISDFEKHISFFPGSFVYHNKWGIGRINEANHRYLVIDFSKKRNHQMEISMAVSSLEALPKTHFWVLKSIMPPEKLKKQIIEKPMWCLRNIITSLDGADSKTLKNELVPSILTASEWTSWSSKARKILQESPFFGLLPEKSDFYYFSETPLNPIEKFNTAFRMEDSLLNKIKIMRKALQSNLFENDLDDDVFLNIIEYFNSHVSISSVDENLDENFVNALFLCNEIETTVPSVSHRLISHLKDTIQNLDIQNAKNIIKALKINEYKDTFIEKIREYREDWRELVVQIIPYYHTLNIIKNLEESNELELLQQIFTHIQTNAHDYKGAFIWFTTTLYNREWLKEITDDLRIFSDLIRIANLIHKDIQNKYQVQYSKRLFSTIEQFLFEPTKESPDIIRVVDFIHTHNEKEVVYLYSLINQISEMIPNRILDLRDIIIKAHANFDFRDQFDFEQSGSTGFLTLPESYENKKKILQQIHEVDVPANSKEIEKARAYGDLKENAEYKAALEHQEFLNNKVAQIKRELEQARIFDKKTINTNIVGFGTKIELLNLVDDTTKEYVILGPWESNPDKGIISYLSPLGQQLYKKKINDKVEFILNEVEHTVKIQKIDIA